MANLEQDPYVVAHNLLCKLYCEDDTDAAFRYAVNIKNAVKSRNKTYLSGLLDEVIDFAQTIKQAL